MFNKIQTSEFYKNVLTLISGTAIAQAIPILISPILTRIYSPSEFGLVAIYLAVVNILVLISTGRYPLAIMLPKDDQDANEIKILSISLSLITSVILLIVIHIFKEGITNLLNSPEIKNWLYLVPFSVFFRAVFQSYEYYENRKKQYKNISYSNILQTIVTSIIRLFLGFKGLTDIGLISGSVTGVFSGSSFIRYKSNRKNKLRRVSFKKMLIQAKRYKKFPLFTMPSNLLNSFSIQLPIFLLSNYFIDTVVGFYSFSHRMLSMPMTIIGRSFSQVYYQKATVIKDNGNELKEFTFSIYKKLLLIGILPISIIGVWGDYIFMFIFGQEWAIAGVYSQFLSIWILFNFISSPLSQLFSVLEKQQRSLIVNSILLIFRAAPLIIGGLIYSDSALNVIILYSIVSSLFWIGFCFYLLNLVHVSFIKALIFTIKVIFIFLLPLLLIRIILQIPFLI